MLSYLISLVLLPLLAAAIGPPTCVGRPLACALQINVGFNPPVSSRRADCSRYQRTTITPAPTTLTTTVATETITVTVTGVQGPADRRSIDPQNDRLARRQTPAIPTYLHPPCNQPGVYASACACIGIPPSTTTYISVTATTTTTVTVPPTPTTFSCQPPGGTCPIYNSATCGLGQFNLCSCTQDADGELFCAVAWTCQNMVLCTVNADCAQGERCHSLNCCPSAGGRGVCVVETDEENCNPAPATLKIRGAGPILGVGAADAWPFGERVE
ncbi:hypothetical protein BJY00DRAFT_318324 [Aspergillus carlsbadensis]|nr:hypothetical protein BJY00DRAFT_318324 [Aspergillus carlsbadensis]